MKPRTYHSKHQIQQVSDQYQYRRRYRKQKVTEEEEFARKYASGRNFHFQASIIVHVPKPLDKGNKLHFFCCLNKYHKYEGILVEHSHFIHVDFLP